MPTDKELLKQTVDEWLEDYQGGGGNIYLGVMHDNPEETAAIFDSWQAVDELVTMAVIEAGCYNLYKPAILKANQSEYGKRSKMTYKGEKYYTLDSLRLGTHGWFSGDDEPWYEIPEPAQVVQEVLDELLGDWPLFSDEWGTCGVCGKIIRTSPDSYSWVPDYIETEWDGYVHEDCLDVDEVLESYSRKNKKCIPPGIRERAEKEGKIICMEHIWENGLHHGMNDDPKVIAQTFKKLGLTDWWWVIENSQFYVEFQVCLTPEGVGRLSQIYTEEAGPWHDLTDEEKANYVLQDINAFQGYDTADEISKALRGEHSDYFHAETYQISQQDFIDGKLPGRDTQPPEDDDEE